MITSILSIPFLHGPITPTFGSVGSYSTVSRIGAGTHPHIVGKGFGGPHPCLPVLDPTEEEYIDLPFYWKKTSNSDQLYPSFGSTMLNVVGAASHASFLEHDTFKIEVREMKTSEQVTPLDEIGNHLSV